MKRKQSTIVLKFLILIFFGVSFYGCAAKKLIVMNADTLLEHQIEKKIPLTTAEKSQLSKDIDVFLNTHKKTAAELITLSKSLELDKDQVEANYEKLNTIYRKVALDFSKILSHSLASLNPKQQNEFIENMKKEDQKAAKVPLDEILEKTLDRFEWIFGTISEEQKSILIADKGEVARRHQAHLKRREAFHQRLRDIFQQNATNNEREKVFNESFTDLLDQYPDADKNKQTLTQLVKSLGAEQKKHFQEKLQDLRELLSFYIETDF